MRKMMMGMAAMLTVAVCTSRMAYALSGTDTMMDWLHASAADRSRVLDDLQSKNKLTQASRAKLIECLNGAAEIAGHSELHIADVAEACSETSLPKSSTDI